MSKYANEVVTGSLGGKFTLAPAGNHAAVCIGFVDIGHVDNEYQGHVSKQRACRIYFELSNTIDEENEGKPFVVGQDYSFSMHSNANLRKMLNSWFGIKMDDVTAREFNHVNLLGCEGMVNVTVKTSGKGSEYNEVTSVTPMPSGMDLPVLKGEEFLFNYNPPFKQEEYDRLEKFVQDKIQTSEEWFKLFGGSQPAQASAGKAAAPLATTPPPLKATVGTGKRPF
jgi:hypothetical protein